MNVEVKTLRGHPVAEGEGVRNVLPPETYETTLTKARALRDLGYVDFDEAETPAKTKQEKSNA